MGCTHVSIHRHHHLNRKLILVTLSVEEAMSCVMLPLVWCPFAGEEAERQNSPDVGWLTRPGKSCVAWDKRWEIGRFKAAPVFLGPFGWVRAECGDPVRNLIILWHIKSSSSSSSSFPAYLGLMRLRKCREILQIQCQ